MSIIPAAANADAPPIRKECEEIRSESWWYSTAISRKHRLEYRGFNVKLIPGGKKNDRSRTGLKAFAYSHNAVVKQYA